MGMLASMRLRSSIPRGARERVLSRYASGARQRVEYRVDGKVVGRRDFHETGELEAEWPERNGRAHGVQQRWDTPGELLSTTPYRHGLEHGTARQWRDGKLIGSYRMVRGTGIDLWWGACGSDSPITLSEARYFRHGQRHGFEWWINSDQRSVFEESHYHDGIAHGIARQWNGHGRLRRGFPAYWVQGQQVTKRAYLAAAKLDPTLPPFRELDNLPRRSFPPELAAALGPRNGRGKRPSRTPR
jgi:hypothetical protein